MWIQIAATAFLAGQFIYHRWIEKPDVEDKKPREFSIPRTDQGAPVPMIFGRVRVRAPNLAWLRIFNINPSGSANVNALFVCGIAMNDGKGTNRVHAMWVGDTRLPAEYTGDPAQDFPYDPPPGAVFVPGYGHVEELIGDPSQVIASDGTTTTNAETFLGRAMLAVTTHENIPAFRGYICVHLHWISSGWLVDPSTMGSFSFECSSYETAYSYPGVGVQAVIGKDLNPANAIWDLCAAKMAKLGLSTSLLDFTTFGDAATTLHNESHGYSRSVEDVGDAESIIGEILEQIDGVLRHNPATGKIELKLIRGDYDPSTIPHITKANAEIVNLAIGGWQGVPNKVRVVFTNRADNYNEGSAISHNQANAVGQDGVVREQVLRMPGVCWQELADAIASRELSARSRPVIKMRVNVDRSFIRILTGDVVKVTWTDPDISGLVFRVANVERGTLGDRKISLDLISDHFYTWRNSYPTSSGFGSEALSGGQISLDLG